MTIGKEIAEYIKNLCYEDIPNDVVHQAKRLLLDCIGTIFLGSGEKAVGDISGFIEKLEVKPECTVIGKNYKTNSIWAAFANASYSQVHEFNDGHGVSGISGGSYHPGRVVIPTALAMGEKLSLSGKEIITAVVIGYDVATKILGITKRPPSEAYSSAAVAARMLGLNEEKILNALGIAGCMNPGCVGSNHQSDVNQLNNGCFSKVGIEAAMMANEGLSGPPLHDDSYLSKRFKEKGLWKEFEVMNIYIKPYPTCRMTHAAIDAVLELRKEIGFKYYDVNDIVIHQLKAGMYVAQESVNSQSSYKSCQFNLPYAVACAVMDGEVGVKQYTKERISDPKVHELIGKIKVIPDETLDIHYPKKSRPSIVKVKTNSGNMYIKRVDLPKGDPENPLTDEEIIEKFKKSSMTCLTAEHAHKIEKAIFGIEKLKSISELMDLL